jgi:hypothetical protein
MSQGPLPGQLEMGNNSPISLDLTDADSNAPLKGSGHSSLAAQITTSSYPQVLKSDNQLIFSLKPIHVE